MNKLIEHIWKKYHKTPVSQKTEKEILEKAHASYKKAEGKFKLSTFISWFTRQRATKSKKK